ncbi:hypothetical protein QQ008_25755 [Fulvivirgaceae bacterium BMA10]|uniref:Uncharacterized protein n=1 Tax=Splendidivirga corallicola TaxID=3051826 RepID=A0ABT8KVL6_9BACT|nr:hypothetical protein [Fulvivirgaceae bacterium BMA10]
MDNRPVFSRFLNTFKKGFNPSALFLELLVVFCGVYLAFILNNYNEQLKIERETKKVLISLKSELENFRLSLPGQSNFQYQKVKEWTEIANANNSVNIYKWRYIQPQHDYEVIEHAINTRGADIVDFDLFKSLLSLYTEIKKLEDVEDLVTDVAGEYRMVPSSLKKNGELYLLEQAHNRMTFLRFIHFSNDRARILQRVADLSIITLKIINEKFTPEELKQVEFDLIKAFAKDQLDDVPQERVRELIQQSFPNFTEGDIDSLIEELFNERNEK